MDRPRLWALLAVAEMASSSACTGAILERQGNDDPGAEAGGGRAGAPGERPPAGQGGRTGQGGAPGACTPRAPIPRRIWRLSNAQYSNAVRDLLGLASGPTVSGGGESPYAFLVKDDETVSAPLAYSYASAAASAAAQAAARIPTLAPCPTGADPDGCAQSFIRGLGTRAFRRPMADVEVASLMAVYQAGKPDGYASAIQLVIEGMLQMPAFLYRTELGAPTSAGKFALTPHEVAAQLSFFLLNGLPDEGLLAAVASGKLGTEAGRAGEVDRLLSLPRVRQNIDRVVVDWFGARQVLSRSKDAGLYPEFTEALKRDLLTETERFVDDVAWKDGSKLSELLRGDRTFVNGPLARFHGLPYSGPAPGTEFVPATFPPGQRAGLLTAGSLMATHAQEADTSVVHRGIYVHSDVLCLPALPPPPSDLLTSPEVQAALARLPSERARADYRASNGLCQACHAGIDGLGLLLERYDPIGRYRERDDRGPVDASATVDLGPALQGRFEGAPALAQRIVDSGALAACASHKILSFALGQESEQAETCEAVEVRRRFEAGGATIPALFRAVALAGVLRVREGAQP